MQLVILCFQQPDLGQHPLAVSITLVSVSQFSFSHPNVCIHTQYANNHRKKYYQLLIKVLKQAFSMLQIGILKVSEVETKREITKILILDYIGVQGFK